MRTGLEAGIVLSSPKGNKLKYTLQIHFAASNNVAEYEALIHGLRLAKELGIRRILCYGDSDLVVQQSSGDWRERCKHGELPFPRAATQRVFRRVRVPPCAKK